MVVPNIKRYAKMMLENNCMSGKCIQKDAAIKVAHQYPGVLKMADVPGNLNEAGRRGGMGRTGFYGWKRRVQTHGLERLKDLPPIPKSRPSITTPETEAKLLSAGMAHPSRRWSSYRISSNYKWVPSVLPPVKSAPSVTGRQAFMTFGCVRKKILLMTRAN